MVVSFLHRQYRLRLLELRTLEEAFHSATKKGVFLGGSVKLEGKQREEKEWWKRTKKKTQLGRAHAKGRAFERSAP